MKISLSLRLYIFEFFSFTAKVFSKVYTNDACYFINLIKLQTNGIIHN